MAKMTPHSYRYWDKSVLALIIISALLIRFYDLENIPSGIYTDEAATGYDAYSLLKTGKDLHGTFLPILVNHHDVDYLESMYTYLTILPVFVFDLNIFSTRFIAALFGTLAVFTTYLLTKELFNRHVALISALLVAVSPWHLQFSRIAFNGILVPFFITLGLFFFLRGLRNPRLLIASAFVFGLSLHTYSILKALIPITFFFLLALYYKQLKDIVFSNKRALRYFSFSIIIFLILASPIYYLSFFGEANLRFNQISVFASSEQPIKQFLINFLKHLSPDFLFFRGDSNMRHNLPYFGQILVVLIPFILLAMLYTLIHKTKAMLLIISLFLIGTIPSSLTNEGIPHALRSISAVPFIEIMAAIGIFLAFEYLKNTRKHIRILMKPTIILLLGLNILFLPYTYFITYPQISEQWFLFGFKDAISYTEEQSLNYNNIFLSQINHTYIFPLFFAKIDPTEFHNSGKIGKYIICDKDIAECYEKNKGNLFIVKEGELSEHPVEKYIYNSKNQTVLRIIKS